MKKLSIMMVLAFVISSAFVLVKHDNSETAKADAITEVQEEVTWYDWNTGFELAKKEGKIAIIDCYTDWCGWCKKMDATTFEDPEVMKIMNESFVAIKFNPEKPGKYVVGEDSLGGKGLLRQLAHDKFGGYPTIFVYVPQNAKMFQHPGYQDADKFGKMLNQYVDYQKGLTSN